MDLRDDSFLPHGTRRDGEPETQPIYLTDESDNLNRAAVRVLLSGVEAAPFAADDYERVLLLFDGRDEEAKAEARRQWTLVKAAGRAAELLARGRRRLGEGAIAAALLIAE